MREVKFRAWISEDSNFECDEKPCMSESFAFEEYMSVNEALYAMQAHNHILMQYTGLKDKNGIEIYEGDVVDFINREGMRITGIVKYGNCSFYIDSDACSFYAWMDYGEIKVIGNIYENPELLEVKKLEESSSAERKDF